MTPPIASWSPGPSVPRSAWINTASCEICGARFSFFRRRRHHCRRCGKCVCDAPRCAAFGPLPVACELDPTCTRSLIGLEVPAGFGCSVCLADIHVANTAVYAAAQERYAGTVQAEAEQSDAAEAAALRAQAEAEERESLRAQAERDAEAEARRLAEKTLADAAAAKRGAEAKAMQAVAPCEAVAEAAAAPETAAEAGSQLTAATKAADEASMARLLDAYPGCVNWANNWGCTALHYACMGSAREGAAALLVRRGADRNMRNGGIPGHPTHGDPKTPLDIASAALRERLLAIDPSEVDRLRGQGFPIEAEGIGRNSTSVMDPAATEAERSVLRAIAAAEAGGTSVSLRFEDIGDAGATQLADMLCENATVTTISLCEMGLGESQIGGEGARALADGLRENATVTEISLCSNQIGNEGARALADWLRKNATVTTMYLGDNQIGDEGARALADGLRENATVTIVDIGGLNPMGDVARQAVLDIVDQNRDDPAAAAARVAAAVGAVAVAAAEAALAKPKFATPSDRQTTALLEGAKSGDAAAVEKALADGADKDFLDASASGGAALHYAAVANHASVIELLASKGADMDIRNKGGWLPLHRAAWTGDGCSAAVEALLKAGADPTLTCVNGSDALKIADGAGVTTLIRAHLETFVSREAFFAIAEHGDAVAAPPAAPTAGGAAGAEAVADPEEDAMATAQAEVNAAARAALRGAFEAMRGGAAEVSVAYLGIGDVGAGMLAEELRSNTTLRSVRLNGSQITDVGAGQLADALRTNASVEVLDLGDNSIGEAGATQLADALRTNTSVEVLNLDENSIGEAGATQLAGALRANTSVKKLGLAGNSIGDAGATQLAEALRTNTALEGLHLVGNPMSGTALQAVFDIVDQNMDDPVAAAARAASHTTK